MTAPAPDARSEIPVGEVVAASTAEFTAQCRTLYDAPPLGALVRSGGDAPVYGVVGEVSTRSMDPGRRPTAIGEGEETAEEVYRRNPQLDRLLATEFRSIVVGYADSQGLRRYLAPLPPKIHAPVLRCRREEVAEFSRSMEFLPILLAAPFGSQDDVVASFLRLAGTSRDGPDDFLVGAGRELASLLGSDTIRLNSILRRLTP